MDTIVRENVMMFSSLVADLLITIPKLKTVPTVTINQTVTFEMLLIHQLLLCLLQLTVTASSLRGGRRFRVTGSYTSAVASVAEITKLSGSFDHPKTVNALSNDRTSDKAPVVLGRIRRLILQAPAMLLLSLSLLPEASLARAVCGTRSP